MRPQKIRRPKPTTIDDLASKALREPLPAEDQKRLAEAFYLAAALLEEGVKDEGHGKGCLCVACVTLTRWGFEGFESRLAGAA